MRYTLLKRLALPVFAIILGITAFIFPQSQLQVGYAVLTTDSGTRIPVATALFTYTNSSGILVSQAGVGAVEPITSGRIFVDQDHTETGVALVNPSSQSAAVNLILRDASGAEVTRSSLTLNSSNHLAKFVSQLFPNLPAAFSGSLTFDSSQKLAAVALRQSTNARDELFYTTLPVIDLSKAPDGNPLVFPQIVAGEGYTTQLILINNSAQSERGVIALIGDGGQPLVMTASGSTNSQYRFEIGANGTYRMELDSATSLQGGYATVTPDPGYTAPSGSAIFRYRRDGSLITEAGVGSTLATSSARIFVDNTDSYTGVALASRENQPATITFSLLDKAGALQGTTTRQLKPNGHLAVFAHELFPSMSSGFTGLMQLDSTLPVAPVTLKLTINQRNDLIYTTLPVADLGRVPSAVQMLLPQIAFGEGFSTRLIFINADLGKAVSGRLNFWHSDGTPMTVASGNQMLSQYPYQISQGGGMQFSPGNTAKIASIAFQDPQTNRLTREVTVNEGDTIKTPLLVLDEAGNPRDDFVLTYSSLNPEIATIDENGNVAGKKAGFSTITVSSGGIIATGTINVVKVNSSGPTNSVPIGVALDLGRRLYLAASQENAILLAEEIGQRPVLYAGTPGTAGLKNDLRLKSSFNAPEFLALDQARGVLYVSDGANHVIRRIQAGVNGVVETFAGTGKVGSLDGSGGDAAFRNPRGVALDNRGHLWVVDSGNHTIRRINLATGLTQTVAGKAGEAGSSDGKGEQARFNAPVGIALEPDLNAAGILSGASKPVSMIVADMGNGLIRRVKSTGDVETIRESSSSGAHSRADMATHQMLSAPITFAAPTGVVVDPAGNIYVSEPGPRRVSVILADGQNVAAAQAKTFQAPAGMAVIQSGKVVVADGFAGARELTYGGPQITSISPDHITNKGGEKVVVTGSNFSTDTIVVVGGVQVAQVAKENTQKISFTTPVAPSGLTTLTLQNRGGLAQAPILVEPTALGSLPSGSITTIAGGSTYAGDGSAATRAPLGYAENLAVDTAGNVYLIDSLNNRVRRIAADTGIITTVAGNGQRGSSGDGGPAVAAELFSPKGIALDAAGNLFISDTWNDRIRKVDVATGIITTVCGSLSGFSGDGGPAVSAKLHLPEGIGIDKAGNLFIADVANQRIRRIDASTGIIATVAGSGPSGSGTGGFSGDKGAATAARLNEPRAVTIDSSNNLFIADSTNNRIRRVDANSGMIDTVAGSTSGFSGDGGLATSAQLAGPEGVAIDGAGNLLIADTRNRRIRRVSATDATIATIAGSSSSSGFSGDNGPAVLARLSRPKGLVLDAAGNLFFADYLNYRIRKIDRATAIITTVAGNGQRPTADDYGPAIAARLYYPRAVVCDTVGNMFVADAFNQRIIKISATSGTTETVAGDGTYGYSGDGDLAVYAQLFNPSGVALDSSGNLFISDSDNHVVRKVDAGTGEISTVAGNGYGSGGDNGPAINAGLEEPLGIAIDSTGNLYIADSYNQRIRKVDAQTKIITTVAGNGNKGYSGDGRPAIESQLAYPSSVAVDTNSNLYISDTSNNCIRRVDGKTGLISTVAGTGSPGFSGDGHAATAARLWEPHHLVLDSHGNLFIADYFNDRIRRVDAATGIITTVTGNGSYGFLGDNGAAGDAQLSLPWGVALDAAGNLLIVDTFNHRIRAVRAPLP